MSEKKYRVKSPKSVCYIGTKKECEVYLLAFVDGRNSDYLEIEGSVVKDQHGGTVIYMEEMKLPAGFCYTEADGNEWSFVPSTGNINVVLIEEDGAQHVLYLTVEQVEKLKVCLDAWLLYMKG